MAGHCPRGTVVSIKGADDSENPVFLGAKWTVSRIFGEWNIVPNNEVLIGPQLKRCIRTGCEVMDVSMDFPAVQPGTAFSRTFKPDFLRDEIRVGQLAGMPDVQLSPVRLRSFPSCLAGRSGPAIQQSE